MSVSKRLRFEVLRRDDYTCRYCGKTAAETELHVDHVLPVALGGKDEPTNLVTACEPCNTGKTSTAPNSELVADIEEKALLWGRALTLAMERRDTALDEKRQLLEYFENEWMDRYTNPAPLGHDWAATVTRFYSYGLSVAELDDAIDIAYQSPVKAANVWKYFCGVCWRKVDDLRTVAQELIESGEVRHGA